MPTCLSLLGPGLDGQLAVEVMRRAGWEVIAASLRTVFTGYSQAVQAAAKRLQVPLIWLQPGDDYYERTKHPRFGYTREIAPCLDCKVWMLTLARERMAELGATKLVTGDCLGQRMPGQSKRDFALVDFHAGVKGQVVRPLSGKLLPGAGMDRELLLDIQGRGRQRQLELARAWNWTEIPAVTSGCLLADHAYGRKYREAIEHAEDDVAVLELLAIGRHFRLGPRCRVILGRSPDENAALCSWQALHEDRAAFCQPMGTPGPAALLLGDEPGAVETAARLILRYSRTALRDSEAIQICITRGPQDETRTIPNSKAPLPPQI